jgi:hypothetical protein
MRVVRPSDRSSIWRLFDALHCAEPTFGEVGFTLTGMEPSGPAMVATRLDLGRSWRGSAELSRTPGPGSRIANPAFRCWRRARRFNGVQR